MKKIAWRTYIIAFIITSSIFALAFGLSNTINQKRVEEIRSIENKISVDILSIETQFSLLEDLSCGEIGDSFLSKELASIGSRLQFMERERSPDDPEFLNLKKYYSLLLIKDQLLTKQIAEKCGDDTITILYFYSNKEDDCEDCGKQGAVLTRLQELYPEVRVYPFDYYLDTPAVKALISVHHIEPEFPALKIKNENYYGLKTLQELDELIPELEEIRKAREEAAAELESATSTEEN